MEGINYFDIQRDPFVGNGKIVLFDDGDEIMVFTEEHKVRFLLNIEMAGTSPPFGLGLFVMKGVAPPDTTMGDIYRAALPFLGCDLIVMALIIAFPTLTLWLPGLMR